MKRLVSTMACDVRLQYRNGFYHAAGFVALFWMAILSQVPADWLAWLMPAWVLSNLMINTFYFVAGLVLLEKGEGTLMAQVVTPLRPWEYLVSKVTTLFLLSVSENLLIVLVSYGAGFDVLPLVAGMVFASALLVLLGFIAVSRYDSVNEYLFPSFLYTLAFVPPFLDYFDLVRSWLFYLHPLQASLLLNQAAFRPIAPWQWLYALAYSGLWVGLVFAWSRRAFARFIVATEGSA